jgi:hypothetical protein
MTPVRVITEGASPVLPLRMVAAGTGQFTSIVLYVIGEGRWTTENFPEVAIPFDQLEWDGAVNDSNYSALRTTALQKEIGRAWISTYAQPDALFDINYEYDSDNPFEQPPGGRIGFTYLEQVTDDGLSYDEYWECEQAAQNALHAGVVVDPCNPDTDECAEIAGGEIDARHFTCGDLTDLSVALVGMHPTDVWVTRLEANLPRYALSDDLALKASDSQKGISNFHITPKTVNYECPAAPVGQGSPKDRQGGFPMSTGLVLVTLGGVAALLAARRRRGFVRA